MKHYRAYEGVYDGCYSLIGTCRAAGVDPRTWMEDVLSKLPYWQRDGKDLAGLLPRAWAKENQITPK